MKVHGWGRFPVEDAQVEHPCAAAELRRMLAAPSPAIARGMGRSYGDSALAPRILGLTRLHLLQAFDPASGTVRCEAGVTLDDLLEVFVPRGWFLPVVPGTRFVSVGGAIASDVHGKNHHAEGCFSAYVDSLDLMLGGGEIVSCSAQNHPELFRATCGGMGLTGVILSATLRLKPIAGPAIEQLTLKAAGLREALALFDQHRAAPYSVAWIDCLARGKALGRSLLMLGRHAGDGEPVARRKRRLAIPVDMPGGLLNGMTIRAFNGLYYGRAASTRSESRIGYEPFFFPLDAIRQWNRLYGKRGFIQYQFVLPRAAGAEGMRRLLERIATSGQAPFLAVLKALGPENGNPLSFPTEGYTLALDFRMRDGLLPLLDELDALVLDHGGRHYLAKDARMSEQTFKRGYPRWQQFEEVRARYGAHGKFASRQSLRLGLE